MYRQLNEEINQTPLAVKILIGLACVSTLLQIIMFGAFLISFGDLGTLVNDGSKTLVDLQELIPDVKHSLQLIQNICTKHKDFC